jgi:hypothetical protein
MNQKPVALIPVLPKSHVSFKACTQLRTEFFIFHISFRINCNRIIEGLLCISRSSRCFPLLTKLTVTENTHFETTIPTNLAQSVMPLTCILGVFDSDLPAGHRPTWHRYLAVFLSPPPNRRIPGYASNQATTAFFHNLPNLLCVYYPAIGHYKPTVSDMGSH